MPNNILITPGSASIQFSGSAANTIRLQVEDSGSIAFYGNSGSLFGITDSLSGSLMSVNDISGLPILEVFSDDRVVMGSFGKNTLVVSGSTVTISGSLNVSGSTTGIGGGGSGTGFPFSGSAVITGSLLISQSVQGVPALQVSGGIRLRTGSIAVYTAVDGASFGGFYVDSGTGDIAMEAGGGAYIGSNTSDVNLFAQGVGAAFVGTQEIRPQTNLVQSLGTSAIQWNRLHVGTVSASTAIVTTNLSASSAITASTVIITNHLTANNVSLSGSTTITGSMTMATFNGGFTNVGEMSFAVSGTITASGTATVNVDLNRANYYSVSASAAGTVTWTITNPPAAGRMQTFVIEYLNGGVKTNSWFTNTRWPAGVAPTLTTGTAVDLLSFSTDDAGANWRGVLLQRGSA